jgi:hypothetical protein
MDLLEMASLPLFFSLCPSFSLSTLAIWTRRQKQNVEAVGLAFFSTTARRTERLTPDGRSEGEALEVSFFVVAR